MSWIDRSQFSSVLDRAKPHRARLRDSNSGRINSRGPSRTRAGLRNSPYGHGPRASRIVGASRLDNSSLKNGGEKGEKKKRKKERNKEGKKVERKEGRKEGRK